jgi:hypothetical protein
LPSRTSTRTSPGHGYDLLGQPGLRAAIARRFTARGLPTTSDQVLVTAGGQAAIALVLAALVTPGDRVLVEHPTYPNALDAVTARGARCVPVPLDLGTTGSDAWDLDIVTAAVRDAAPRLAYLIPDHQNPTGALLDDAGRARLVALARRTGTPLLIDETLAELTFAGPVRTPVAAHGAVDSPIVITVGSAAKVAWGGPAHRWIRTAAPTIRAAGRPARGDRPRRPGAGAADRRRLIDDLARSSRPPRRAGRGPRPPARPPRRRLPGWRPSHRRRAEPVGRPRCTGVEPAGRRGPPAGRPAGRGPAVRAGRRVRALPAVPYTLRRDRVEPALERLARPGTPSTSPTRRPSPLAVRLDRHVTSPSVRGATVKHASGCGESDVCRACRVGFAQRAPPNVHVRAPLCTTRAQPGGTGWGGTGRVPAVAGAAGRGAGRDRAGPHAAMVLADLGATSCASTGRSAHCARRPELPDPTLRGRRRVSADLKDPPARRRCCAWSTTRTS